MANEINSKFKKSNKDEYDALYEAIFGERSPDDDEQLESFYDCLPLDLGKHMLDGKWTELQEETSISTSDDDHSDDSAVSSWSCIPDLILERVYSYLNMQERYYSSMVCQSWYHAFHLPNVWRVFVFDDKTLTRSFTNYHSGLQYVLDDLRSQLCLKCIGRYIHTLIFKPTSNFSNLYKFMNMISFYAELESKTSNSTVRNIGSQITNLQYTFPCNMAHGNIIRLYGTGGKLLDALKRLMSNLPSLNNLELTDLMLDSMEALQLLDDMCNIHCLTMKNLVLINVSKMQCPLLHVGMFLNLQKLVISPQSLDDDVLYLLSDIKLRCLCIVQNSYTPTDLVSVSSRAWKRCRQNNPQMKVHLLVESFMDTKILLQEGAPIYTISFDSQKTKLQIETIARIVDNYSQTLRIFGYMGLPRYYEPKSFHERIDSHLMYLCNNCIHLESLVIRERISTSTLLLISTSAKKIKHLYVRKNAVILRNDWPRNPDWSEEFYQWIRVNSRSYEATEREVSYNLGYKWTMLSDKEYKKIDLKNY